MDTNLSQSSCEIIKEMKNMEVFSETENISSQPSDKVEIMEIESQPQTKAEFVQESSESTEQESSEKESASSTASGSQSSASTEPEEPQKRKRKRKRKRKKKTTTAYSPPTPFTKRYKRIKLMEPAVLPKLHIRFDDIGAPDIETSEYNLKPRVIQALARNFLVHEDIRSCKIDSPMQEKPEEKKCLEVLVVTLKPRIIQAIIVT